MRFRNGLMNEWRMMMGMICNQYAFHSFDFDRDGDIRWWWWWSTRWNIGGYGWGGGVRRGGIVGCIMGDEKEIEYERRERRGGIFGSIGWWKEIRKRRKRKSK